MPCGVGHETKPAEARDARRREARTVALHPSNRVRHFSPTGTVAPRRSVGCGAQGAAHQKQCSACHFPKDWIEATRNHHHQVRAGRRNG